MKILITEEQYKTLNETNVICKRCEHNWDVDKEDSHPYLCHMCGYDQKLNDYNLDELELFWKNYNTKEEVKEKWSNKYKRSIDCNNPKGFSQRAHCQGRKKHINESNVRGPEFLELIEDILEIYKIEKTICNIEVYYEYEDEMYNIMVTFDSEQMLKINDRNRFTRQIRDEISKEIVKYIPDFINFYVGSYIRFCKEPLNESKELSYKELIKQIINNLILPQYEDIICDILVEDSFERTDVENKRRFEAPSVKVVFISDEGTRNNLQQERMYEDIMDEIWDTVFDYSSVAIDMYWEYVKECKGKINEDVKPNLNKKDINVAVKTLSILSPTFGEYIPLKFNLDEITTRTTTFLKSPIFVLHISVKNEFGEMYNIPNEIRFEISNELLKILGDMGLYDDIKIEPYYDFIFNKIK